jgi:hypothetical protein
MNRHLQTYRLLRNAVATLVAAALLPSCTESFEERCRREAADFTAKQCPRRLDECTRLDSMTFEDTPVGFKYWYSVEGKLDADSIYADLGQVESYRETLVQNVRADIGLRQCKEHKFTFTYNYVSATDGHMLMEHVITPADYE